MTVLRDFSNSSSAYLKKFRKNTIKNQVTAAKYIEQVAVQAGVDVSNVDILELFAGSRKNLLITSKHLINKKLFNYAKKNKPEPLSPELLLAGVVYREIGIKKAWDNMFSKEIVKFNFRLTRAKSDVKRAKTVHTKKLAMNRINKYTRAIENCTLPYSSDVLFDHLVRIAKDRFWKFVGIDNNCLVWVTINPVILTEVNNSAGLSIKQNMGYYMAKVRIQDSNIELHPYKDNISYDGHTHPYTSGGGICWGNTYNFAMQAQRNKDISGLLAVTASVISTYSSDGGPHARLADFVENGKPVENIGFEKLDFIDPDVRLQELLNKKDDHTTKKVNEMANQLCDAETTEEHCGDTDCEGCNDNYGHPDEGDEDYDPDEDY